MRIACWNIQHPGTTEKLRTVVGVIATLECDVLALQEVAPAVVDDLKTRIRYTSPIFRESWAPSMLIGCAAQRLRPPAGSAAGF